MKNIFILIIVFLIGMNGSAFCQAPLAFNYQGLARGAEGEPLKEQDISLFITLLAGGPEGFIEYEEEHFVTTSANGLFSIRIGEGLQVFGNLDNIDWGINTYYINTEIDPSGEGGGYVEMGVSQLYSVPYALYAAEAGNASSGGGGEQTLQLNGTVLSIENGNSVNLSPILSGIEDDDSDPSNELQNLSISGNQLSIEGRNTVTLPSGGTEGGSDSYWEETGSSDEIFYPGKAINIGTDIHPFTVTLGEDNNEAGYLTLSQGGQDVIKLQRLNSGEGFMELNGPSGNGNIQLTTLRDHPDNGFIAVADKNGDTRSALLVGEDEAGVLCLNGPSGNNNVVLSYSNESPEHGWLGVMNGDGNTRGLMYVRDEGSGDIWLYGKNGNINVSLSSLASNSNYGHIAVYNSTGSSKASVYVNNQGQGIVFADSYTSLHDNPEKSGEKIAYAMLQGPESALYLRGTGTLIDGEADIVFPKHFSHDLESEGITMMITPLSAASKGIAIITKTTSHVVVKELFDGKGNYQFDWEVKGVRKGFDLKSATLPVLDSSIQPSPEKQRVEKKSHER